MPEPAPEGVVSKPSGFDFDETVARVEEALAVKGLILFVVIDHSGEAQRVGLSLRPTKLLIFGSPRAGTPLMDIAPLLALDLPLKALVWRDDAGQVWVSYLSPAYLAARYGIPADLLGNIAGAEPLLASAIQP